MQSTTVARRHRAVGGAAAEQELEAAASAAILPLVSNNFDIVHLVIKHYQWDLLLDKVSHLEQKYEKMISKAEDTMTSLREEESVCWSNREWDGERNCLLMCYDVVEEFSLLKQDVASIKKFAHPGTSRHLRKREVETVQNSIKKLLSSIDGRLTTWHFILRRAQFDADYA